ncbi:GFA family protein [Spongorhabdus nitratireducens]
MNHSASGHCSCGNTTLNLSLPLPVTDLTPRACDCDFCVSHQAAYLSHPEGQLQLASKMPFRTKQQGSKQAQFLFCSSCNDLIAVICQIRGEYKGTVSARYLSEYSFMKEALPISPKVLSPKEKWTRWEQMWMPVAITNR